MASPLVEMTGIEKHFGAVTALGGVDFSVGPAEVEAWMASLWAEVRSMILVTWPSGRESRLSAML